MYEELGNLIGLFGGGSETSILTPADYAVKDATRFVALLTGKKDSRRILDQQDLATLQAALRTLKPPTAKGKEECQNSLRTLGILGEKGGIQWANVGLVGRILQENENFHSLEMYETGLGYESLCKALTENDYEEKETDKKMSAKYKSGHRSLRRLGKRGQERNEESRFLIQAIKDLRYQYLYQ